MNWIWPLTERPEVPREGEPGAFATARKHDVHTGVDLYCAEGSPVRAVESGVVVWIGYFTGPNAESPWWRETMGICVRGAAWTVLYGELKPTPDLPRIETKIQQGDLLGHVERVLKKDKGLPTTMLHIELYDHTVKQPVWWRSGTTKPVGLLNPTDLLTAARLRKP